MVIGTICGFIFILIQLILIIDFAHRFILKTSFLFSNKIFLVGMKVGLVKVKMVVKHIILV